MSTPLHLIDPNSSPVVPAERLKMLQEIEKKILWLSAWMIHNANHLRPARGA